MGVFCMMYSRLPGLSFRGLWVSGSGFMLQGAPKSRLRQDVDKAVWIRPLASASGS